MRTRCLAPPRHGSPRPGNPMSSSPHSSPSSIAAEARLAASVIARSSSARGSPLDDLTSAVGTARLSTMRILGCSGMDRSTTTMCPGWVLRCQAMCLARSPRRHSRSPIGSSPGPMPLPFEHPPCECSVSPRTIPGASATTSGVTTSVRAWRHCRVFRARPIGAALVAAIVSSRNAPRREGRSQPTTRRVALGGTTSTQAGDAPGPAHASSVIVTSQSGSTRDRLRTRYSMGTASPTRQRSGRRRTARIRSMAIPLTSPDAKKRPTETPKAPTNAALGRCRAAAPRRSATAASVQPCRVSRDRRRRPSRAMARRPAGGWRTSRWTRGQPQSRGSPVRRPRPTRSTANESERSRAPCHRGSPATSTRPACR